MPGLTLKAKGAGGTDNKMLTQKIFWNWDIHYACNYRCPYCFLAGKWDIAGKENRYPGIKKWEEVWGRIYRRYGSCHIHFSGGEPFTYPDFLELAAFLSEKHTLEFSTNLSFDAAAFIKKIDPLKVKLGASFHPEFVASGEFLEKVSLLKEKGYHIHITFVAYPPQLKEAKPFQSECENKKIKFAIQPFRGIYKQRPYPDSYNEEEKDMIKSCGTVLAASDVMFNFYLDKKQVTRRLCRMGQMYGKIYASADVYRCCSTGAQKLGNLLDQEDFRLSEEPLACGIEDCSCWRAMIVGEERKWLKLWKWQ